MFGVGTLGEGRLTSQFFEIPRPRLGRCESLGGIPDITTTLATGQCLDVSSSWGVAWKGIAGVPGWFWMNVLDECAGFFWRNVFDDSTLIEFLWVRWSSWGLFLLKLISEYAVIRFVASLNGLKFVNCLLWFFAFYLRAYFQLSLPWQSDTNILTSLQGGPNLSILRRWFLHVRFFCLDP